MSHDWMCFILFSCRGCSTVMLGQAVLHTEQLHSIKDLCSHNQSNTCFGGVANRWSIVVGQDCNHENKSRHVIMFEASSHLQALVYIYDYQLFYYYHSDSQKEHSEINILYNQYESKFYLRTGKPSSFTLGLICCPTAGGHNLKNTPNTNIPYLCFHLQVIAQFWGRIWGVKPSLRVPCLPCWPASWCTALSPSFGTLTHSWRVRQTCCH